MSAKYVMQEMVDLNREGETLLHPRMVMERCCGTEELARMMARASTFGEGEITGLIRGIGLCMARLMADGCSVKLDGIGTFAPSLVLREDKERERPDGTGQRRNARSVGVGGVNFRAEKAWVAEVDRHCRLERGTGQRRINRSGYTPEERLQLALRYLEEHPTMNVSAYAALTGLGRTTAGNELRRWANQPGTGIGIQGFGTHRLYVRKPTADGGE